MSKSKPEALTREDIGALAIALQGAMSEKVREFAAEGRYMVGSSFNAAVATFYLGTLATVTEKLGNAEEADQARQKLVEQFIESLESGLKFIDQKARESE
jgi:hypothetical protein